MGEYKRVEDVLGKIAEREQIHGLVEPKHSPDAKYKVQKGSKLARPTLRVGSRLVWPIGHSGRDVSGYALGIVLDWEGNGKPQKDGAEGGWGDSYWNSRRCFVQVIRVSNPDWQWMVGHLRQVTIYGWSNRAEMPMFTPEECNPKDYGL